jgi:Mn-dependent DtxR family transcriptional regulator
MTKESDILKIVKEDILEVVGRENKKIPLKFMKLEVTISHSFVSKAIKELEEESWVKISSEEGPWKEYIQLTEEGRVRANVIIKKHSVLEKYFKERRSEEEAIEATNILEHYISTEVLDTIKKLSTLKKKGIPLTEFRQEKGLIANINLNIELFERMISMGIYIGEKIRIMNRVPSGVIVKIRNKKFVLDKSIAKEIRILEYEKF